LKYLIVGLGNVGDEYSHTRHNIGFDILDAFARASNIVFEDKRYAFVAEHKIKGRNLILIKPTTYMNLSGKAVNYWLKKENIELENLLVIVDDLSLPIGTLRLRPKGSDGGHNGLTSINEILGSSDYARLRFGIGNNYPKGKQIEYVLGRWSDEELQIIQPRILLATEIITSFATIGLERTMTTYNKK
jgi:PTH1 family peptidyl-tRNA hydrolase